MQGTTNCAPGDFSVNQRRLNQRQIACYRYIALQAAIEPRDTIKNGLRHLDGG